MVLAPTHTALYCWGRPGKGQTIPNDARMTDGTIDPPFQDSHRLVSAERMLLVLGMLVLFFNARTPSGDGMQRYQALGQLLEGRGFSETGYSMIGPIFATPLWYFGKLVGSTRWWVGKFNFFVFLIGVLWLWRMLKPHMSASFLRKFILLLMAASMFGGATLFFYGEMFTTILVAGGIVALSFRPSLLAWTAIIIGVQNTTATLIGLAFFALFYAYHQRRLRYLLAPVVALLLMVAENWLRRGSPFLSGYEGKVGFETLMPYSGQPGFSYPFLLGVLSIFLSFGKGLLFFTPGLFVPVRQKLKSLHPSLTLAYTSWVVFLVGIVVVYGKWWAWYGGWYWGPRFFLIASVISCFVIAVYLVRPSTKAVVNLMVLTVLGWSSWVGLNGLMFVQQGMEICIDNQYRLEFLCWYVPEFSVLIHPFVEPWAWTGQQLAGSAYVAATAAVLAVPLSTLIIRQLAGRLQDWFDEARKGWKI